MVGVQLMLLGGGSSCQACGCGQVAPECICPLWEAAESGSDEASSTFWIAQLFYTGNAGKIITAIQIRTPDWSTLANRASARLHIYSYISDTGGPRPDQSLHVLTNPTTYGNDVTFTSAGFTVSAGTRYWAVLRDAGIWEWTNNEGCLTSLPAGTDLDTAIPYCQTRWAWYSQSLWEINLGGPYMMRVFGDDI
jgi:hypothetical protein